MPRSVKWTKKKPYIVAIDRDSDWYEYGPFHLQAAAAYAVKVIHESVKRGKQPSLIIANVGHAIIEVLGGNSVKPSPHYRVRIADADIYDMATPKYRAEINYLKTACYNAGADGVPW